jgi:hypothetical protein
MAHGRVGCGKYAVQVSSEPIANQALNDLAREVGAFPTRRLTRLGRRMPLTALIDIEMQGFLYAPLNL